ncbi:outer membrane lipoprotein-sorting protein [Orbaceae bacterium ESL0727]|nr:outer membrane lipoprotein-sorting protein [Orbaceae bacterium ESL0727]
MRTILLKSFTFMSILTATLPAYADQAYDILKRSDQIRNPQTSFVVNVLLKQFENNKLIDQTRVTTHSRQNDEGQFLTIVSIEEPSADRGKLLLRNNNILWFYDPKSKASVRMSPRQRLLGNASNGDVITSNFTLDYTATLTGDEMITDGDRNNRLAWKLQLKASNTFAPYPQVELWIDKENDRPLKGKFYGQSGKLLKIAWYRNWQSVFERIRPTEVVIADGFNPNKITLMQLSQYQEKTLPLSWFNKEWLAHFTSQGHQ